LYPATVVFLESLAVHYNLHPLNLIIISGIFQLFVVGGILYFQRKAELTVANRILAAVVVISAVHFSWYMILDTNLDQIAGPILLRFCFSFLLAIGPLLYLYTNILTVPDYQISRAQLIHFIPVSFELVVQFALAWYSIVQDQQVYQSLFYVAFKMVALICSGVSIFIYLKKSLLLIENYERSLADQFSEHTHLTLQWLNGLVRYTRVSWMFWLAFECCFILFWHFQLHFVAVYVVLYLLMIIMVYSTYWIGVKGFQASGSLSEKRFNPGKAPSQNFYAKTNAAEVKTVIERLEHAMKQEKLYRDENLSLQMLAERINENPNLVSYVLNTGLNQSFYDYINQHRVEEVKSKLADPKYAHLKLIEIAFECGFNSKATFNRAFKKVTGTSPTVYRTGDQN
jgi:AraC-like DNA-binding protein